MINEGMMFLASYGYYGGTIGNALNKLEQMGVFAYVLPFLLIFTLVFGILSSIKLFRDNRGVDAIIALVVALMALQMDMVPIFFAQVFPRMGVALAAILVVLVVSGLFINPKKAWIMYVFLGGGIIAAIAVLVSASGNTGFYNSYWFQENGPVAIVIGAVIIVMLVVVGAIKGGDGTHDPDVTWRPTHS